MLRFFVRNKTDPRIRALYDQAVAQARLPVFYRGFGVADTLDGRFDLLILHLVPLIDAQRDDRGGLTAEGQALFDTFVNDMEQNLRAIGASDMAVPKKMKKIGEAFYGRFGAYRKAEGVEALAEVIARNVHGDAGRAGDAAVIALARYALALRLAARDCLDGVTYPDPASFLTVASEGALA